MMTVPRVIWFQKKHVKEQFKKCIHSSVRSVGVTSNHPSIVIT